MLGASSDTYVDLGLLVSAENDAGFEMAELDTTMENLLELTVTDMFGRTKVDTIELRMPEPPDSLRFDASMGVDRIEFGGYVERHILKSCSRPGACAYYAAPGRRAR